MPKHRITIPKVCRQCGRDFQARTDQPGAYCSRRCRADSEKIPLLDRLWAHSEIESECWVWHGSRLTHRDGYLTYGQIRIDGATSLVHVVSWLHHRGPIPEGHGVLHTCDNPPCWNPAHLFTGTKPDNMRDMAQKRRQVYQRDGSKVPRGERAPNATLSDDVVRQVLIAYAETSLSQRGLAASLGLRQERIAKIISGRGWAHVVAPPGVREACRVKAIASRRGASRAT